MNPFRRRAATYAAKGQDDVIVTLSRYTTTGTPIPTSTLCASCFADPMTALAHNLLTTAHPDASAHALWCESTPVVECVCVECGAGTWVSCTVHGDVQVGELSLQGQPLTCGCPRARATR